APVAGVGAYIPRALAHGRKISFRPEGWRRNQGCIPVNLDGQLNSNTQKPVKKLITLLALAVMLGCASFSTNVFRLEVVTTGVAYTAYQGYTNALSNGTLRISADQSNAVKVARIQLATSLSTLESWRAAYETKSAFKHQLQSALDAATANSSNFVFLIKLFQSP